MTSENNKFYFWNIYQIMVSLSTGIIIADDCISEFTALRMKRAHRYLILKVNDDKSAIVIEKLGAREETFDQFKENMPKD
jgi:cofilin